MSKLIYSFIETLTEEWRSIFHNRLTNFKIFFSSNWLWNFTILFRPICKFHVFILRQITYLRFFQLKKFAIFTRDLLTICYFSLDWQTNFEIFSYNWETNFAIFPCEWLINIAILFLWPTDKFCNFFSWNKGTNFVIFFYDLLMNFAIFLCDPLTNFIIFFM